MRDGNPQEGAGPPAAGTGSPAQPVVAAHGAHVGDGIPQWRRPTGLGDGESSPAGGRNSLCACGGWQPPMARAHRLGGRGVQPNRWSQFTMRLWGIAAPNGAGSQAGGKGSPAQPVVAAHRAPVGDGSPQWCGLTGGGGTGSPAQPALYLTYTQRILVTFTGRPTGRVPTGAGHKNIKNFQHLEITSSTFKIHSYSCKQSS